MRASSQRVEPGGSPASDDPGGPSGVRYWLINAVLLVVIGGSLFDIVTFREHWPFSPYWMYSHARTARTLTATRLYGVPRDGEAREVAFRDPRWIHPFDVTKLRVALERMAADSSDPGRLQAALTDCLERYEALRLAGMHEGPSLRGLRLYRLHWELDPWARNAQRPGHRELLAEVLGSATGMD